MKPTKPNLLRFILMAAVCLMLIQSVIENISLHKQLAAQQKRIDAQTYFVNEIVPYAFKMGKAYGILLESQKEKQPPNGI